MVYRVLYAAGPGDVIQAHKYWKQDEHFPHEVSITFSSQFEDFCKAIGAEAYIIASHHRKEFLRDGPFTLEHRPKPLEGGMGLRYHVSQGLYGLILLGRALQFRANVAVIDSGSTHHFFASLFRLMGIQVVPVLHNTIWPPGYPPTRPVPRLIRWLDSRFFRWVPLATIGVSPECVRQVEQITGGRHRPLRQIRAQFRRGYLEKVPPPPPHDQRPFRIMFIGRVNRTKGVFDILEMARKIEARAPGQVHWELCGSGPDLEELRRRHQEMGLESVVQIRGWTSLPDLFDVYARSHCSIVPTRSSMPEGLTQTAAEAILAGRPVITNPVNPALEVLRPACVAARTDDVDSYVEGILELLDDSEAYHRLCQSCSKFQDQFYDREQGLASVLRQLIKPGS